METKINIAEILKNKPQGTKLWTDMFGSVTLYVVTDACDAFQVKHHNKEPWFDKDGKLCKEGVLCIYPSKSMRDWEKFAWKKGDILAGNNGTREVLFSTWVNDSYTKFVGIHCLITNDNEEVEYDNGTTVFNTDDFKCVETEDAVQTYINIIEERLGGKLNRETLEVEKAQPEFKDGDIVTITFNWGEDIVYIFKSEDSNSYSYYAWLNGSIPTIIESSHPKSDIYTVRLSTEAEKQKLFEALAKEGKAWNAEKKMIVNLKPKVEMKPFDKVLVRDETLSKWRVNLFGYKDEDGYYNCVYANWIYCIPYEGNEHLLGTTKDVEG